MSVNSAFQVACKVYLKKSLQDFVQEYKRLGQVSSIQQKIMSGSCSRWKVAEQI
jgi:hypothetical protein